MAKIIASPLRTAGGTPLLASTSRAKSRPRTQADTLQGARRRPFARVFARSGETLNINKYRNTIEATIASERASKRSMDSILAGHSHELAMAPASTLAILT